MRWFLDRPIRTKLLLVFGLTSFVVLAVGLVGVGALRRTEATMLDLRREHVTALEGSEGLRGDILDAGRLYRQVILDGGGDAARTHAASARAAVARIDSSMTLLQALDLDPEAKKSLELVRATLPDWKQKLEATLVAGEAGDAALAREAAGSNGGNAATLVQALRVLADCSRQDVDDAVRSAQALQRRAILVMALVMIAGAVLGMSAGLFVAKAIGAPVRAAADVLEHVAQGDFTQQLAVTSRDEVGRMAGSLNAAVARLRDSLREVRDASSNVSTASRELSAASQNISAGAQEQASSLEETAASLEEMTSVVQQNADNAQQASQLARATREVANTGGHRVATAIEAMAEIRSASHRIADIITTIDEIAFQTNLLALNAAVEAARAGEQGRGFAVVASEVRNLAGRSASAAREIKTLIGDSVDKVEAGTRLVNESGETLNGIVGSVKRVADLIGEIAASSREQSTGIEQVNTAVTQMDSVTQSNASQTEELAGTAEGLAGQAERLMHLVQRFRLGDDAALAPAPEAPRPAVRGARRAVAIAAATARGDEFEEF